MFLDATELIFVVLFLGIVTGGFSNVTSGGAGVFTIYILTNWVGLLLQVSTGTVLAASTIIVLIGAVSFWRKKQVNTQLALTVGISGVIGAFLASVYTANLDQTTLKLYFGVFTLSIAIYTGARFFRDWRKRKKVAGVGGVVAPLGPGLPGVARGGSASSVNSVPALRSPAAGDPRVSPDTPRFTGKDPASLTVQILKGIAIGALTGLFGVSLASLSIVLFMLLFKLDTKMILGTSLFASFFRYLGGSLGHLVVGQIDWFYFAVLTVGGVIGSLVGAKIILGDKEGSKDIYIKILVIGILLFISYEYLIRYLIAHYL